MSAAGAPEERFSELAETVLGEPDVSEGRMFGSQGLKVGGKVFAMLVKGRLVVKLPAERVGALVEGGVGEPFDPGHGRLMKEWVSLSPTGEIDWLALADEARRYVSAVSAGRPRR